MSTGSSPRLSTAASMAAMARARVSARSALLRIGAAASSGGRAFTFDLRAPRTGMRSGGLRPGACPRPVPTVRLAMVLARVAPALPPALPADLSALAARAALAPLLTDFPLPLPDPDDDDRCVFFTCGSI